MKTIAKLSLSFVFGALLFAITSLAPRTAAAAPSITPFWWNCQADMIFETSGELQVHCTNPATTGLDWTAVNISNVGSSAASRFVSMAESAILSGRRFRVFLTNTDCASSTVNCKYSTSWSIFIP
jgi:hypothetical protein